MRFLFDANMPPPLALALRTLSKSVVHVRDIPELGPKAPDPLIMAYSAENGYLVLSRDLAQSDESWFKPTLLQKRAGYFLVRASRRRGVELQAWELVKLMVKAWEDIERHARENPVPFLALVKANGRVTSYS
ncbi:hypothetical protein BH24GEM1_BH24GEM1_02510 [soil metagenome]